MKPRCIVFIMFILHFLIAGQEINLFEQIQSYLIRYRQTIDIKDIVIENGVIYLELEGRRTNHKSLLILGFYAVGRSLQKNKFPFHQVQIIVSYEMKNVHQIVAISGMENVRKLSMGQMSPDQFFSEVQY